MWFSNSRDIFQKESNEIYQEFEFFHMYIDDLLIISKGN